MRFSLSLITFLAALPAWADTITVHSTVTNVTLYPESARVTRTAQVDVPAGKHRLVLPGIHSSTVPETLQLELDGAQVIGTVLRPASDLPAPDFQELVEERARQDLAGIEAQIRSIKDQAQQARLAVAASDVSLEFLRHLGTNSGLVDASPEVLRQIAQVVDEEAARVSAKAHAAEITSRNIEEPLEDLEDRRAWAEKRLGEAGRSWKSLLYVAVEIDAPTGGSISVDMEYLADDASSWSPGYVLHLDSGTKTLAFERYANVLQITGEHWENIGLSLSTLKPTSQSAPSLLWPHRKRITPTQKESYESLEEPIVEAAVIVDDSAGISSWAVSQGIGVTYDLTQQVTIQSAHEELRLELDQKDLEVSIIARAIPSQDDTAFRMVQLTNDTGEELLFSSDMVLFVDDEFVGTSEFPGLVPGQETELGFGPIDGLRLERHILDRNEGDRGIISRSNQQVEKIEIEVKNLTDKTWPVRVLDRVPYSEQEDLQITWAATPRPSEENVDKKRGILAWDLELAPGEEQIIRLDITTDWPEGMELR